MYYVYILKSLKDSKYYFGSTNDLKRRLSDHNSGRVKSTSSRRPFLLHYSEECCTRARATRRELFFKKRSGYKWLKEQSLI